LARFWHQTDSFEWLRQLPLPSTKRPFTTSNNIRNTDNTGSANGSADINSIEVSKVSTASSVLTKTIDEGAQMILF
jgi:hypothetical protein